MADPTDNLYHIDVFAKLFDLTPRRIQQLAEAGHFPKGKEGKYALVPTIKGYIRFLKTSKRGDVEDDDDVNGISYRREKALLTRAQRQAAERENELAEGRLVPTADVEVEMAALIKQVVAFLETLPDTLERDTGLTGAQVERMRELIDQERERFHERLIT